jgi:hypothetical protein
MRIFLFISVLAVSFSSLKAQVKVYFMMGTNLSSGVYIDGFYSAGNGNYVWQTDGKYQNKNFGKYFNADILIEKRINKTIYGVTGLTISQVGYENSFSDNFSEFNCTYLGIPLMFRLKFFNAFLMDVGPVGRIPIKADLKETALQGSIYETSDHQNIAQYLTTFSLGWAWQNTLLINRYTFTFYFMGGKTKVNDKLVDNWKLGTAYGGSLKNNSLFLRDIQPRYVYQMIGLKIGLRF